jgi:nickel-dependent lactate racemase
MRVNLAYDRTGLDVDLPDRNVIKVLRMREMSPIADSRAAMTAALQHPIGAPSLREIARGKQRACVVISDYTRPVPNKEILPPIFAELAAAGITSDAITILVATGIHTPSEGKILEEMVGRDILEQYRVSNHFSQRPEELVSLGTTKRGTPVEVNRHYQAADLKIVTGLIEPHFMAGFSGGRKAICPGICSLNTMKVMHGPKIMESPRAVNGVLEGNPFHIEALEIAHLAGVDFLVNVVIDEKRRINGVFAGDLEQAHQAGVAFCREHVTDHVPHQMDVVVTSNAGYPLDSNFYQSVKGMVTALDILKPGGTVIMAAACTLGVGGREFMALMDTLTDPAELILRLQRPGYFVTDQWQVEQFCKVLQRTKVCLYTTGLSVAEVRRCHVEPVVSVEAGVAQALQRHGSQATIAVIPEGPYVLGRVQGTE